MLRRTDRRRWTVGRTADDTLLDTVAAVLLGGLGLASLFGDGASRPPDALGVVLILVGATSLVVVRRHPLHVLGITAGTAVAIDQLGYAQNGLGLTVLWTLYVVALRLPRRTSVISTAATLVLVNLSLATSPADSSAADHLTTTVILAAGWAFGRAAHARRSRRAAEERALLAEERTLVAREMQDLVVHELAELTVQVTAARRTVGRDTRATEELLIGAESNARAAVAEVRRILDLLSPAHETTARSPLPGISDLEDLAELYTARGLTVSLHLERTDDVAAGPALLAYRVVESALAEAAASRAGRAEVSVEVGPFGLRVRVDRPRTIDGATTGADATSVSGLLRRAQLYGGTVRRRTEASRASVVLEIPAAGMRRAS